MRGAWLVRGKILGTMAFHLLRVSQAVQYLMVRSDLKALTVGAVLYPTKYETPERIVVATGKVGNEIITSGSSNRKNGKSAAKRPGLTVSNGNPTVQFID